MIASCCSACAVSSASNHVFLFTMTQEYGMMFDGSQKASTQLYVSAATQPHLTPVTNRSR
jgi:hypothetical protein